MTFTWVAFIFLLALVAFIVGMAVHPADRARQPLFWGLLGLALVDLAFLLRAIGVS